MLKDTIYVNRDRMEPDVVYAGMSGSYYKDLEFTFSDEWEGLTKKLIFYPVRGKPVFSKYTGGEVRIPWDVMRCDGSAQMTMAGYRTDGEGEIELKIITAPAAVIVGAAPSDTAIEPEIPEATVFEKIVEKLGAPYVGENGMWFVWDADTNSFIDSGFSSKGEKGDTGRGLTVLGHYNTLDELRVSVKDAVPGDAYSIGEELPYNVYIFDEVTNDFTEHGNLRGVGIVKVEKITDNIGSGEPNTLRVYLDDGSHYDVVVYNGESGVPGNIWIGDSNPPDDSYVIWLKPSGVVSGFVESYQGTENAGRAMVVGRDGVVRPGDYAGGGGGGGSAGVDEEQLQEAVNSALQKAKDSGEFDGESVTITQIEYSTEAGGDTIVTFSDGSKLKVENGKDGKPGKSAYLYAKEAGYTGTEEEFAERLANGSVDAPVKSVNGKTGAVELDAEDVGAPTTDQFEKLSEEFENLPKADWVAKKVWQGDAAAICDKTVFFIGNKEEFYPEIFNINVGGVHTVLWDGVPYVVTGTSYQYRYYLGNGSLVYDGAPDTGEPFCFSGIEYSSYVSKVTKSTSDEEEIAFKVAYGNYVGFDKMPEEYLPDGVVKKVNGIAPDEYGNVRVDGSGGTSFETDETLKLADGKLSVNTTDTVEKNNHLPVTSAAVYSLVGDIEAALAAL